MNNFITGGESFSFTLNSPITKSQWEEITDVNMEHSDKVMFITPKGKKVEYAKVKHGKWIEYPIADGMNQCSVCGVLRFGDSNYCPNCGAKMDGEIATAGEPLPESYKEEADDTEG